MCGIWARFRKNTDGSDSTAYAKNLLNAIDAAISTLVARGPEGSNYMTSANTALVFTRLAINGLNDAGMQPFIEGPLRWMCNGEIYNAKDLGQIKSGSDCEVLGELWTKINDPVTFCRALDGVFAFVLYDNSSDTFVVARDPLGVRPLYWAFDHFTGWTFGSERKTLEATVPEFSKIYEFPPGEVWTITNSVLKQKYFTVPWIKSVNVGPVQVRNALESAVRKRLMTERPVAALLSGGVDSSLIAAIVQKMLVEAGKPALKTFSIGMKGSTDLAYARKVADWIKSDHHEIVVTADEMVACIPDVIRDIESYDITTVRASVGNWMVAREIRRQTECKVVFNGDGSDEVWGSYLYFYRAPDDFAFEKECENLLHQIHKYDVLRSDRCISSHGLEARTPFLDKQFVATAMSVPTNLRRPGTRVEKQILREAFAGDLLPPEVLWRRKEAFSDGVSSSEKSWYQEIQERIPEDLKFHNMFVEPVPKTLEAFWYRSLYESNYKRTGSYWPFWMPKWSPETSDPSARTLAIKFDEVKASN